MNEIDGAGTGRMNGSREPRKCVGDALLFGSVGEYTIATGSGRELVLSKSHLYRGQPMLLVAQENHK